MYLLNSPKGGKYLFRFCSVSVFLFYDILSIRLSLEFPKTKNRKQKKEIEKKNLLLRVTSKEKKVKSTQQTWK